MSVNAFGVDPRLMNPEQLGAMISNLPASCVFDAIKDIQPPIQTDCARFTLLEMERLEIVTWRREAPQEIALTKKGRNLFVILKIIDPAVAKEGNDGD